MHYDEEKVEKLYQRSLRHSKELLKGLRVHSGREPSFTGLSGWVYEQTIQHCIRRELKGLGLRAEPLQEQVLLTGRVRVDLLVGSTAIEIKTSGLFGVDEVDRYKKCQSVAASKSYRYVLLSRGETTYQVALIKALGMENVILLDEGKGAWRRLIRIVAKGMVPNRHLTRRLKVRA